MKLPALCWPTPNRLPPLSFLLTFVVITALLFLAAPLVGIVPSRLVGAVPRLLDFLSHIFTAPDFSYLGDLLKNLWRTLEMALLATSIALILSFPLAFLAARNTSPHPLVFHLTKNLLSLIRSLPGLVWALIFVSAVGLGPLPGVMALALVSTGLLGKFFAESLEVIDPKPVEGVKAHGASWLQLRLFAHLPQAMPDFVSSLMYMLDQNFRSSLILGIVGAGGIGQDMLMSMRLFEYDRILLIVIGIYLTVSLLDRLSSLIRKRVI